MKSPRKIFGIFCSFIVFGSLFLFQKSASQPSRFHREPEVQTASKDSTGKELSYNLSKEAPQYKEKFSEKELWEREMFRKNCLSPSDGSHQQLILATKERMYFPNTFKHVETRFIIKGDSVKVSMKFNSQSKHKKASINYITATVSRKFCNKILKMGE